MCDEFWCVFVLLCFCCVSWVRYVSCRSVNFRPTMKWISVTFSDNLKFEFLTFCETEDHFCALKVWGTVSLEVSSQTWFDFLYSSRIFFDLHPIGCFLGRFQKNTLSRLGLKEHVCSRTLPRGGGVLHPTPASLSRTFFRENLLTFFALRYFCLGFSNLTLVLGLLVSTARTNG